MAGTAMTGQTEQSSVKPDLTVETKKKRRRRTKKKTSKPASDMADASNSVATENNKDGKSKAGNDSNQPTSKQNEPEKSRKKQRKNRVRDDRYFGRFRCRICGRSWDSALVFCIGGTMKVKFRQRCKNCTGEGSWVFPFHLRILKCSQCGSSPCECVCEDCGHLKHLRYLFKDEIIDKDDGSQSRHRLQVLDENFNYCDCEKRKNIPVGVNIDDKKPHRSDLCEKCLKAIPCSRRKVEDEGQDEDNEP